MHAPEQDELVKVMLTSGGHSAAQFFGFVDCICLVDRGYPFPSSIFNDLDQVVGAQFSNDFEKCAGSVKNRISCSRCTVAASLPAFVAN